VPRQPSSLSESTPARPAAVIPLRVPESDAALVHALRAGELHAGAALFDRHASHIRRVLVRVLGPDPEIADLLQDVFVSALSSIDKLTEPSALKGWLTRTAIYMARGRIRRRTRWRFLRVVAHDELPERPAPDASPEDREALSRVYGLLSELPANERIAFALRVLDEMELAEVAEACGVSLATAKRRVASAQRRFAELLAREPSLRSLT
jgi:RNA polymerase sigma-70 factor, ECF subfamily